MGFYVRQRVICINDKFHNPQVWPTHAPARPVEGVVYTVREIVPELGQDLVRLCEIINPKADFAQGFIEMAFAAARFRPLIQTDISQFHAIRERFSKRENA